MTDALPMFDAARTPDPLDPRDWQATLVGLLAQLEHLRSLMDGLQLGPDGGPLLDIADAMLSACEDLTREVPVPANLATAHMAAVAKVGAYYTAASRVRTPARRSGMFGTMLSALTGTTPPKNPGEVRDALFALVEAVHHYFAVFMAQVLEPDAARSFVDAAVSFEFDLKELIRELPEG